jgi:hypothetical protein
MNIVMVTNKWAAIIEFPGLYLEEKSSNQILN